MQSWIQKVGRRKKVNVQVKNKTGREHVYKGREFIKRSVTMMTGTEEIFNGYLKLESS